MNYFRLLLFTLFLVAGGASAEPAPDNMAGAAARSAEQPLPVSPAVAADIEALIRYSQSAEFQAQQEQAQAQIRKLLGIAEPVEEGARTHFPHRAVVFISASIPVATLRHYAEDLEKIDGVLVLRGLVDGMQAIGPTAEFMAAVLRVDPFCQGPTCVMRRTQVIVDPLLFRANRITQVPAFAFQPNMELDTYCARDTGSEIPTSRAVIYGDAALSGLIAEYARLTKDARAKQLLEELDDA